MRGSRQWTFHSMWQRRTMRRTAPLLLTLSLFAAGCSSDDGGAGQGTSDSPASTTADTANTDTTDSGPTTTGPDDAVLEMSLVCDPLDERACLLPWPNNAFTVPDEATATGRRLDIQADSTPANVGGAHID